MQLVIEALEEHVELYPEEAKKIIFYDSTGAVNMERILQEMKAETEWGKEQYKKLIQLTLDLLRRGKINMPENDKE